MDLSVIWFILITVLFVGYFVLEGFDYGVGMLVPVLGRDSDPDVAEKRRRVVLNTIGPVWDGNEVWLLTAGGAIFAAFPHWYATLFSGFYLALLLILVGLILRGIALDYRGKQDSDAWRSGWDKALWIGSFLPALLWGVAVTNIVRGVPIDENMEFTGNLLTLLNPAALLGGLVTLFAFLAHGAMFVAAKTSGDVSHDARRLAVRLGLVAAVVTVPWLLIINLSTGSTLSWIASALAAVALLAGIGLAHKGNDLGGFWGTFAAIALVVVAAFSALFPDVMPSTLNPDWSLTHNNASSTDYTLKIMTIVAVCLVPVVLLYQAWTYWVFRKRISTANIPSPSHDARRGTDAGPLVSGGADTGR